MVKRKPKLGREGRFTFLVLGTILLILLCWLGLFYVLVSRPFDKMFELP